MTNGDSPSANDKRALARAGLPMQVIVCVLLWVIGIAIWAIFDIPDSFLVGWIGGLLVIIFGRFWMAYGSKRNSAK